MTYIFKVGNREQQWSPFNFVATKANTLDLAMDISKFNMDHFESGGGEWTDSWENVARSL